jgi:hypothetical protein
VTTFVDPSRAFAYVQDASGAIRVAFAPGSAVPEVGDRVRVDGELSEANAIPVLAATGFRVVGREPLPAPKPMAMELATAGHQLGMYVESTCILHTVARRNGQIVFAFADNEVMFTGEVLDGPGTIVPDRIVDANIRVRGVCGPVFNSNGQLTGFNLLIPSIAQLEILTPGPPNPSPSRPEPLRACCGSRRTRVRIASSCTAS